jgi:hypothetical protein
MAVISLPSPTEGHCKRSVPGKLGPLQPFAKLRVGRLPSLKLRTKDMTITSEEESQ